MENEKQNKKLKILCLHGFRTSGAILKKLVERWPQPLLEKVDLVFMDGPYPAQGKSDVDGIFEPPFYEWFQADEEFKEFYNFEECLEKIQEFMVAHGPFDGLLGFSQGAILAAAIPGMQREGVALTKVPKVKFVIIVSGAKFGGSKFGVPKLASASFSTPITTPSLHLIGLKSEQIIRIPSPKEKEKGKEKIGIHDSKTMDIFYSGETDFMKDESMGLVESFVDPVVIHHPKGHTIPRLVII